MLPFIYVLTLNLANVQTVKGSTPCNGPLGILLCQINCKRIQGCDLYRFDSNNLNCCIGTKREDQQNESAFWMTVQMEKTPSVSTEHCLKGFRIFHTRKNRFRCLTTEGKSLTPDNQPDGSSDHPSDHPPDHPPDHLSGSMLFTYTGDRYSNDLFLIDLKSKAVSNYGESDVSRISAMVFNKLTNTLYYAGKQENIVKKTTLSTFFFERPIILKNKIVNTISTMALDEEKEILFVSGRINTVAMFIMGMLDLESNKFRIIDTQKEQSYSMAVVSKQRKIYSSSYCCINVITYEGQLSVVFPREHRTTGVLAVNPKANILYYSEIGFNVFNLTSKKPLWQTDLPAPATGIEINGGYIFVTLKGGEVYMIREDKGKYTHGRRFRFSDFKSDVLSVII